MFMLSLFSFLYGFLAFFTILLVLMQKGKSNMGFGSVGGSNQMLFGSSGGQTLFQKITWTCCILLLGGSLILSVVRGKQGVASAYRLAYQTQEVAQSSIPEVE